jgi:hypothetical protein
MRSKPTAVLLPVVIAFGGTVLMMSLRMTDWWVWGGAVAIGVACVLATPRSPGPIGTAFGAAIGVLLAYPAGLVSGLIVFPGELFVLYAAMLVAITATAAFAARRALSSRTAARAR